MSFLRKSTILLAFLTLNAFAGSVVIDDDEIVKSIQNRIASDPQVSSVHIVLSSLEGDVVLSGTVDTGQQATALVEIAQSTPGVTDVITSDLKIKDSEQPFTDAFITAKVKGLFLRDKLFTTKDISVMSVKVETKNGIVHLSGITNSRAELQNAIKIAQAVKGVKKIKSYVTVSKQ